jgi:hypothetical protein
MKKPPASVTTIDPADTLPSTGTRDPAVRCDLKEAAAMLFTSPGTLRYRIEQGLLSVIYEGDKMDITRSEILRYGRTSHPDPVRGKSKKTKNGRERYVYLNVSFRQGCEASLCESEAVVEGRLCGDVICKQGVQGVAGTIAQIVAFGAHTFQPDD